MIRSVDIITYGKNKNKKIIAFYVILLAHWTPFIPRPLDSPPASGGGVEEVAGRKGGINLAFCKIMPFSPC